MSAWIPVSEKLPENSKHKGAFCPKYLVFTKYGITIGWYSPDRQGWEILAWFMTSRSLETEIDFERGDVLKVLEITDDANKELNIVKAWMSLPEPYKEEAE
jgi:hypothetical protein